MTTRRGFLRAAAGAGTLANKGEPGGHTFTSLGVARSLVRRGELGKIHFCRAGDLGLRDAASYILDRADCVIEIEPDAEGAAILGSRGTLAVWGGEWRVFAQEG